MKKFLSFILVLAMVLGCVSMVSFATGEEELVGYEITYNSATYGTNNSKTPNYTIIPAESNPSIYLNDEASTNGGQYNRDFTVINPNSTSIKLVFELQYSKQFIAQEDSAKKKLTWTATGISGGTKYKTITVPAFTAINFSLGFTTNESGNIVLDAGAYTWTDSGNTYTSAATTVAAKDIFLRVTHSTLALSQSYVLVTNQEYATFPAKYGNGYTYEGLTQADVEAFDVPILGGDYISVDRPQDLPASNTMNYDARINMLSTISENGDGTYYYSGWFRFHEMQLPYQRANVLIEQVKGGTKSWPAISGTSTGTDWFYATGTFEITDSATLTTALLRVQTWGSSDGSKYNDNIGTSYDMDAVSLRKVNDDGTYTGNLIVDGDCALGPDTDWTANGATISNPVAKATTIAIKTHPTKLEYELGEELDTTGLELNVLYTNGVTKTVTSGFKTSGFDNTTAGEQTVTVTYEGLTANYAVTVLPEVTVKDYPDVAVKFTSTSETQTSYTMCSWGGGQFLNDDATFNDTLTFTYDVYNVGTSSFTARFYFNDNSGKNSDVAGSTTSTLTIKPGEKKRFSISIDFVDGVATLNASGNTATLSQLRLRFAIKFSAAGTGNALVIAPVCDDTSSDYYITKHTQADMSKEVLKTLPDLSLFEIVAQKIEVNTDLTVKNIPRYQTIPFDSTDIQVDPDGNKYIQLKYRGYNMNGMVKYLSVSVQKDWNTIGLEGEDGNPNNNTVTGAGQKAVQPYSSAVWDIKIMLTSDGKVPYYTGNATDGYTYASAELSTISLRYLETDYKNTTTKNKLNGEVYYIQALNDSAKKFLNGTKANNTDMTYFKDLTTTEIRLGELDSINTIKPALEIGSSLAFNVIAVPEDSRIENTRLKVTRINDQNEKVVTYCNPIEEAVINNITFKKSYNTLIFKYEGITAQCMADDLTFELVSGTGENEVAVATKSDYSVRQYATNLITDTANPASDALKTLLSDMLVYGAEAQRMIGYNEDDYATAVTGWELSASEYVAPTDAIREVKQEDEYNKATSVGLHVSNVNKIYFRVSITSEDAVIKLNDNVVTADANGVIYTDDIFATGYADAYTLTITIGDTVVTTVMYNVNAYIAAKDGVGEDATTVTDIVKALNNYGQSAVAYANA